MSKYNLLWKNISASGKDNLILSFEEIEKIAGVTIDHSFLNCKKELLSFGYKVDKISIKNQTIVFKKINETVVIYVHGKGGNAKEAEYYKLLFSGCDVVGLDYKSTTPWAAEREFPRAFDKLTMGYKSVILIANSIGAYFAMSSLFDKKIEKAFFISPVVDMAKLIENMMVSAGVTKEELRDKGEISTAFGETLSQTYYEYAKAQKIVWNIPTYILYGEKDNLTDKQTITEFAKKIGAALFIMQNGEHWFHTKEQLDFLNKRLTEIIKIR